MPTYDYKCDACAHRFEKFQSITAAPIRKCPKCGKSRAKRLIGTGAGLIFKGSGFYITDYRDSAYKDKAKSDSGATTSGESKPSENSTATKSESKTPAKADSKSSPKESKKN